MLVENRYRPADITGNHYLILLIRVQQHLLMASDVHRCPPAYNGDHCCMPVYFPPPGILLDCEGAQGLRRSGERTKSETNHRTHFPFIDSAGFLSFEFLLCRLRHIGGILIFIPLPRSFAVPSLDSVFCLAFSGATLYFVFVLLIR